MGYTATVVVTDGAWVSYSVEPHRRSSAKSSRSRNSRRRRPFFCCSLSPREKTCGPRCATGSSSGPLAQRPLPPPWPEKLTHRDCASGNPIIGRPSPLASQARCRPRSLEQVSSMRSTLAFRQPPRLQQGPPFFSPPRSGRKSCRCPMQRVAAQLRDQFRADPPSSPADQLPAFHLARGGGSRVVLLVDVIAGRREPTGSVSFATSAGPGSRSGPLNSTSSCS